MERSPAIDVAIKGPRGPADLSDFASAVNALRNSLKNVWRCATGNEEMEYDVSDLHISSAVIQAAPSPDCASQGVMVAELFDQTVLALQEELPLDPRIDYQAIHAFNLFSGIARNSGVSLKVGGVKLTERYATRIASLLEPDSKSLGSVSGKLEGFSIHNDSRFTLYPPVVGEHVECVFSRDKLAKVLEAVDKLVVVYGTLHYAKTKSFPVRVDVDSFETIEDEGLPTLLNACGILHGLPSSVEMIREMRDDWR